MSKDAHTESGVLYNREIKNNTAKVGHFDIKLKHFYFHLIQNLLWHWKYDIYKRRKLKTPLWYPDMSCLTLIKIAFYKKQ